MSKNMNRITVCHAKLLKKQKSNRLSSFRFFRDHFSIAKYSIRIISGVVCFKKLFKIEKMTDANKIVTHFPYFRKLCDTRTPRIYGIYM